MAGSTTQVAGTQPSEEEDELSYLPLPREMSTFSVSLPGSVNGSTGAVDPAGGEGRVRWIIPIDGSPLDLATTSTVSLERSSLWNVLATVALVVLVAWVVASVVLIALVARARRRRTR